MIGPTGPAGSWVRMRQDEFYHYGKTSQIALYKAWEMDVEKISRSKDSHKVVQIVYLKKKVVLGSTDAYILFVYIYIFTYNIYIYTFNTYIYTVYTLYIWLAKSAFSKLMSRHVLIRFQGQRMSVEQPVVVSPRDAKFDTRTQWCWSMRKATSRIPKGSIGPPDL